MTPALSEAAARALDAVQSKDPSDPTLRRRARLFVALEMASVARFAVDGTFPADAAEEVVEGAAIFLAGLDPSLAPLRTEAIAHSESLLRRTLAQFLDSDAPRAAKGGNAAAHGSPSPFDEVLDLFERLTSVRFDVPCQVAPGTLDAWHGRALVADLVRFASGSLSVAPLASTRMMNCAPNGLYYCFFPLVAWLGHRRRRPRAASPGDGESVWTWWLRATVAGLEAFITTHDRGYGRWDAARFIAPLEHDAPALRPFSRSRSIELIERFVEKTPAALEHQLEVQLRAMFRDLPVERVVSLFAPPRRTP
ncbi:MAG: hypothetical protein AAFR54_00265 [Planctomycetota bacterium]